MTRAAKLSLSQFYERHGKPIEANLPKKSGDGARDHDQCYSNKLANISIDTRKSQRGTRVNDAGCGQNGSRVDVDYDYYGAPKQSSHAPPQPSYARCPASIVEGSSYAGPAVTAKAASMATGDGYAQSGYTSGAALGSGQSGPYAGPCYGEHTPAAPAAEDVWYPPPPPPPHAARGSTCVQQELPATPAAAAVGSSITAGVPVAKAGSALVSFPAAPPPPPPVRRQRLDAQQQVTVSAVTGQPSGVGLAPGMANRAPTAPAKPAIVGISMSVEESRAADSEVVGTKATSPGAAHANPPVAAVEPPGAPAAPAGPKNEFAEKLAARAIANAAKAKSSLLAGSSSTGSGSLSSALPAACGSAAAATTGVFVAPEHPFGRPKLNLKPRSAPVPDSTVATPFGTASSSSASSDSGIDVGEKDSTISVASSAAGRPRLQLQPRSLPLPQDAGNNDASGRPRLNLKPGGSTDSERLGSTVAEELKRKASLFGAAKPREEVLKERGVHPVDADPGVRTSRIASSTTRLSEAAVAKLGGTFGGVGRHGGSHSSVSGVDDEWQVAGHGRKGSSKLASDGGDSAAQLLGDDPFFGSCSKGFAVPAPRAFDREIMRDNRGYGSRASGSYGDDSYGSYGRKGHHFGGSAGGWGGKGGCADVGNDWESDVFTRALPVRQAPLAL